MVGHWERIRARRSQGYDLLRAGSSIDEVAAKLSVRRYTVAKWQRHIGVPSSHDREDLVRRQGMQLLRTGMSVHAVAAHCGVPLKLVSNWLRRINAGEGPLRKPRGTRVDRIPPKQFLHLLAQGPIVFGLPGQTWTCQSIAAMLHQEFGIRYGERGMRAHLKRRAIPWRDLNALKALHEAHP